MIYYKLPKITVNVSGITKVIIDVVLKYHSLQDLIVTDHGLIFILKFCSSLYYFLGIKKRILIALHFQTDGQIKKQNSTIEAYLWVFINYKEDNWAGLYLIAEFVHHNVKNTTIGYTPFQLQYGHYTLISYIKDINSQSKSKSVDKQAIKLTNIMTKYRKTLQYI